jgi:hypothetical protein
LHPEFLQTDACAARSPFGLRLRVILSGRRDLILRGLRFHLTDRFGTSALPEVIPTPSGSEASLVPTPSQLPGAASLPSSPIPIPGVSPLTGVQVVAGSTQTLPFFLRFGCGVVPEGTLFVMTDVAGPDGHAGTSRIGVRVGR